MVIRLDRAFFERVEERQRNELKSDLMHMIQQTGFYGIWSEYTHEQFAEAYNVLWHQTCQQIGFNYPCNIAKYILVIMTRDMWANNALHLQYVVVMLMRPDRPWRPESGIRAVYQNIVKQHYLNDDLVDFIDGREDHLGVSDD